MTCDGTPSIVQIQIDFTYSLHTGNVAIELLWEGVLGAAAQL